MKQLNETIKPAAVCNESEILLAVETKEEIL
ncbi:hypothetical protein BH20BAC1_BH20BAC1_06780 [soil metagenome]